MKTLSVPTTKSRRRIHGAAVKCGWTEGTDGSHGDELIKGDHKVNISYNIRGSIVGAYLLGPQVTYVSQFSSHLSYTDRPILESTTRFQKIILWLGEVESGA